MLEDLDKKVKNLDTLDIALTKWAAIVAGIILIKLFPQLLNIGWLVLIIILVALAARPAYRFFGK